MAAGDGVFWLNTVPCKPVGDRAWSVAVKWRFQPLVAEVLLGAWHSDTLIVLGREVFFRFGIGQALATRDALAAFWAREDRHSATLAINCRHGALSRPLRLAPLPHPSPANAAWFKRFPALLAARLAALCGPRP